VQVTTPGPQHRPGTLRRSALATRGGTTQGGQRLPSARLWRGSEELPPGEADAVRLARRRRRTGTWDCAYRSDGNRL